MYQFEYVRVASICCRPTARSRTAYVPCSKHVPGLATNLLNYFEQQVARKCTVSYNCEYPQDGINSGFGCIDRESENLQSPITYFSRQSAIVEGVSIEGHAYPEFLDTLTQPTVYKDGRILSTEDYVDMQTKEIVVLNVFVNPKLRSGTILEVAFSYAGPGKLDGQYKMISYVQMDEETQETWLVWVNLVAIVSILDLCFLVFGMFNINMERWAWRKNIEMDGAIPTDTPGRRRIWQKIAAGVCRELPLWNAWDVFDIALRVFILLFTFEHYKHYHSENIASTGNGRFEEKLNQILLVPWGSADITYEGKVSQFFDILSSFVKILDTDVYLRVVAYVLILMSFFRLIAYLRVHPRIAVLYKTVEVAIDDLFHFFLVQLVPIELFSCCCFRPHLLQIIPDV